MHRKSDPLDESYSFIDKSKFDKPSNSLQVVSRSIYSNKKPKRISSQDHTRKARMIRQMQQEKVAQEYQKILERSNRPHTSHTNLPYSNNLNQTQHIQKHSKGRISPEASWTTKIDDKRFHGKILGKQVLHKNSSDINEQDKYEFDEEKLLNHFGSKNSSFFNNADLTDLALAQGKNQSVEVSYRKEDNNFDINLLDNILDGLNYYRKASQRDVPELSHINITKIKKQLENSELRESPSIQALPKSKPSRPATSHEKFAKLLKRHSSHIKPRSKIQAKSQSIYHALKNIPEPYTNFEINQATNIINKVPIRRIYTNKFKARSPKLHNEQIALRKGSSAHSNIRHRR
ncbi:unnamed protein product [Moneuplotes crassus]|uniref:Uncharacterized protein n=1 Tax=Euplotes crassus TaxID=5936 RepID=A0AAD1U1Y7_EUPCR|nr:unnamed protein product [Moneuplotes crassus]